MKSSSPENPIDIPSGINRRGFLKTVGGAAAFAAAHGFITIPVGRAQAATGKRNLILFLSDQERAIQWFPPGWAEAHLPNYTALRNSGILFENCCTNTAMCTPSRNTIFTGLFPAQHQSFDTLTDGFEQSESEHQLDPTLPNLATVLKAAGYEVVYKGKWHLSKGVEGCDGTFINDDIVRYGFDLWDPPDAGQDTKIENYGGGTADNDQRFIDDAVAYLQEKVANPGDKPFCLVVSLVNPHDVLGYPGNQGAGGYGPEDLLGDLDLPPSVHEELLANFKPTCQQELLVKLMGLGPLVNDDMKRKYVNFYGNLLKIVDGHLGALLDVFNSSEAGQRLRENTWIVRTSDHGEMGMSHGGMRQKTFNCYEETIRVPLIWSNPVDFPEGRVCPELVSHVDLLPTICSMLGVDGWEGYNFAGVDYSPLIKDAAAPPVQDYILFTFDDVWAGQNAAGNPQGIVSPPNRIQMIRTREFKYARYYDIQGIQADQEEFYDLRPAHLGGTDVDPATGRPVEMVNLSSWAERLRVITGQSPVATPAQAAVRQELSDMLPQIVQQRLQPRPPGSPVPPQNFKTKTIQWTDDSGATQSAVQITWDSRTTTQYQLQWSADGKAWQNIGKPIIGNNGPQILCQPVNPNVSYYRLAWSAAGAAQPQPEPYLEIRGKGKYRTKNSRFSLKGRTNAPGNRVEYKVAGEGGRIRGKTVSAQNWTLPIKGLRKGKTTVYVRSRNVAGAVTKWKRIVIERV
jgi:Arylsulfatase A and related enzymes